MLFQNKQRAMEFELWPGSTVGIDCVERRVVFHLVMNSVTLDFSIRIFKWGTGLLEFDVISKMHVWMKRYGSNYDHMHDRYSLLMALVPHRDIRTLVCSFYFDLTFPMK